MAKEFIKKAKAAVKGNWWRIMGTMLLAGLFGGLIGWAVGFLVGIGVGISGHEVTELTNALAELLSALLSLFVSVGLMKYLYNVLHGAGKCEEIFYGFKNPKVVLKTICSALIVILFVVFGFIAAGLLAVIPLLGWLAAIAVAVFMFYIIIRLAFFVYAIVYDGEGIWGSIKKSMQITKGHVWTIIWSSIRLMLWPIIFYIIGAIPMGVGVSLITAAQFSESTVAIAAVSVLAGILCVVGAVLLLVAMVWAIVLSPASNLLSVVIYEELKNDKVIDGEAKEVKEEPIE